MIYLILSIDFEFNLDFQAFGNRKDFEKALQEAQAFHEKAMFDVHGGGGGSLHAWVFPTPKTKKDLLHLFNTIVLHSVGGGL